MFEDCSFDVCDVWILIIRCNVLITVIKAEEDRLITVSFSIDGESENTQTYYEEIRQLYYRVSMSTDLYTILTSQLK